MAPNISIPILPTEDQTKISIEKAKGDSVFGSNSTWLKYRANETLQSIFSSNYTYGASARMRFSRII